MYTIKAIGAAVVLSASLATPVFAQTVGPYVSSPYEVAPGTFYRSYDQAPGDYLPPRNSDEFWNLVNHGFTGRDPSRVGGDAPSVKPSGS